MLTNHPPNNLSHHFLSRFLRLWGKGDRQATVDWLVGEESLVWMSLYCTGVFVQKKLELDFAAVVESVRLSIDEIFS